jgi:hypothetical protein
MQSDLPPFYFVCGCCNAKWFYPEPVVKCSRCGRTCESQERIVPPWQQNGRTTQTELAAVTAIQENACQLSDHHEQLDALREEEYRRAYREQLRRMACPGCGDGEPIF